MLDNVLFRDQKNLTKRERDRLYIFTSYVSINEEGRCMLRISEDELIYIDADRTQSIASDIIRDIDTRLVVDACVRIERNINNSFLSNKGGESSIHNANTFILDSIINDICINAKSLYFANQ
jgi:hypothetical protein